MSQFRNLVFEGGGVKGIAYVGALEVLEQMGILDTVKRIGGTSAGAINAVLLGCGYSNNEQLSIMSKLDFNKFLDDSWGVVRDTKRLIDKFGWYKGDFFRNWIGNLIKDKLGNPKITLGAFAEETGHELHLMGTNLSTGFGQVFSPERTPDTSVADAVRISMSLPLFFTAIRAEILNDREDVYVDGGVLSNYPIKLFDRLKYIDEAEHGAAARATDYYDEENESFLRGKNKNRSPYTYNRQTLGFRLDSKQEIAMFRHGAEPVANQIGDLFDYAVALFKAALNVQSLTHLKSDDWQRTIYIDTLGVSTTDFGIKPKMRAELVESGKKAAEDYFDWFDTAKGRKAPVNRVDRRLR